MAQQRRDWLALLVGQIEHARVDGYLLEVPAALLAFEIDAVLAAASISANMLDDPNALTDARNIFAVRFADHTSARYRQ